MCRMEIPTGARKCPYCQHYQYKLSMVLIHPAFGAMIVGIPTLIAFVALGVMFQGMLDRGEDFQQYADQIKVVSSAVEFGQRDSGPTVAVIGRMRNESSVDWKEVTFQVEFFDAEGRLVDAGQEVEYSYHLPSGKEAAFKVSFPREFSENVYARHTILVIAAKDGRARF